MVHLLLLPLLFGIAGGKDLEEKKGPFVNTELDVPEGTPVPYPIYQFQVTHPGVNNFRLSGEGNQEIQISKDGWLYLEKPLDWSQDDHYIIMVEALADNEVVEGPVNVIINVLDVNNNAPYFNQSDYKALVRENNVAGVPFTRVFALDHDDPETPNADLHYSLISQIPNKHGTLLFQINPKTGEISTTEEGKVVKPNPFLPSSLVSEMRRRNMDALEDPDYTLLVRVQDLGGGSDTALSGNARVHIIVQQNLWINPGPITVKEHLEENYPMIITKVQSNDPDAIYSLFQKERQLKFPFQVTEDGEILLTEPLDREEKDMYILVVFARDKNDREVDPPMEIQVLVEDVNDKKPVCENEESVFELQEDEPVGNLVGQLLANDDDEAGTLNAQLTYTIMSQNPPTTPNAFSIDAASGRIQALRSLRRKDQEVFNLTVRVNDPGNTTYCKVIIKVIDINNEVPLFEKNDYGNHTLVEDTPVGHTVLTITASDADEPGSGSSLIEFHISAGNYDDVFTVETNGDGVGHLVTAKPLDFESSPTYILQIDARNPEPLKKGLKYDSKSTAFVSVSVTDVDEAPEFILDTLHVTVPENTSTGSVLLTVEAKDPEGKEISFKLDGDTQGWLEIDAATGQIKTKEKLDRETLEAFEVTVTAFEKEMFSERVLFVRLLDVNDNIPKLTETQAFICVKNLEPVIIKAQDEDSAPFSRPFTFTLAFDKKSPNWDLTSIDDTTAKLTLKKTPTEDKTFTLPINIKDNAGMGVTQPFKVRVCNCTELGYCYMAPEKRDFNYGMGPTIGILAGTLGFLIIFIIVVKRINKRDKKNQALTGEEERKILN
uniref:Cadherin 17, LI cadherin (liver-intestine) n=1 Tax=Mastacembelus armatus TaxID=205130 RepID=A0A7N8XZ06_9TELE